MQTPGRCLDSSSQDILPTGGSQPIQPNEALDALVTLTDRSQRTVHSEQQMKFTELSNRPTIALYMGFSDQLIPSDVKNQRLQPLCHLQGADPIKAHPGGPKEPEKQLSDTQKETQSGLQVPPTTGGDLNALKMKKILQLLNL